ncbi:MAG: protein phosphatase 2C domain-containing protein [Salinivirgaceae bacterium]|nr:protein phosphatase 2C domain-containing protein [Salinivirgaceae bacterium]
MAQKVKFCFAVYTSPAGKYNPKAYNDGNEDSFYVDDNLSDDQPNNFTPDKVIDLSDCGTIMAVADGMGGMNAGEVASAIATKTIEDFFAPGKITAEMAADRQQREQYLEKLIVEADRRIKEDEQVNPEHSDMGSTIILAWLAGNELTVSWCGDSRAYRFNPATGIEMLSEDHSYVQDLVRKGVLTYRDTFGHPQGNIVTRSLGEPSGPAQPETRHFNVFQDDIIMLCSDGLSGVVYDRPETDASGRPLSSYNLQDIIAANTQSMTQCREKLFEAAQNSDWYDNVTVILCKITSGEPYVATAATAINNVASKTQSDAAKQPENLKETGTHSVFVIRKSHVRIIIAVAVLLLIIIGTGLFFMLKSKPVQQPEPAPIEQKAVEQSPVLVQSNVADEEIVEEVVETAPMADKIVTANVSQKDNVAKEESPAEAKINEQEKPENTAVTTGLTLTDSTRTSSSLP